MSSQRDASPKGKRWGPSLDEWAVLAALVIALFVRLGILKNVPW
jgi:hypothetical protein